MGKSIQMDISCDYQNDHPLIEHSKSIVHLDVDCFYAQVETVRSPELQGKPLGVQQKNLVVTSNYEARSFGVKKCMSVEDALHLCPNLILVRGEDLTPYRRMSAKISELLHQFTPLVEKLGLDENFIDVTSLVNEYTTCISNQSRSSHDDQNASQRDSSFLLRDKQSLKPVGEVFSHTEEECPCGCHTRLALASQIAMDMRNKILNELGITCSAGIAHNKLLAKLGGALNKPNKQTIVYPCSAAELLSSLGSVSKIPGVGRRTAESLTVNNILTVVDVRKTPLERLQVKIGKELARKIKDYAEGMYIIINPLFSYNT
jgi:DNA polymerase iota